MISDEAMKWIGFSASVLALVAAFISMITTTYDSIKRRKEERRRSDKIKIQLEGGGELITLPSFIRREHLSRSEVLGFLGAIPMAKQPGELKQNRFSIAYINNPGFLHKIDELYKGDERDSALVIECSDDEVKQFDTDERMGFVFEKNEPQKPRGQKPRHPSFIKS